jgi:aminoglycoside phosphotransferase (APT) family kinase protein
LLSASQTPAGRIRDARVRLDGLAAGPGAMMVVVSYRKPEVAADALEAFVRRVLGSYATPERTVEGVSALVFRLRLPSGAAFVRVAEEPNEDLSVDARLLEHLADLGVRVPEVLHVEPTDEAIGRSVLVMSAISGEHLGRCRDLAAARAVARAAGRDLAVVNSLVVDGWGWIQRKAGGWPLQGRWDGCCDFVMSKLPSPWPGALSTVLSAAELDALAVLFEREGKLDRAEARLAHGDFDVTPIFQHEGQYTGLIDFGEIRGTEPTFDLGHFFLHDTETRSVAAHRRHHQRLHRCHPTPRPGS